jgi:hypothetical protein
MVTYLGTSEIAGGYIVDVKVIDAECNETQTKLSNVRMKDEKTTST